MDTISTHTFKHTLKDIHKNTESRKFCFVIGAGASFKSGIPTGSHLAGKWFNEIKEKYSKKEVGQWKKMAKIDENDLAASYGTIYKKRFETDKTSGYEFLVQAMKSAQPSFGHIVLAHILTKARGHVVLTTNFDSLVETAIYQFTNTTPLVCGHESLSGYARPSNIHPLIIKIHRDLLLEPKSAPTEISELDKGWKEPLDNIFSSHIPVVLGYGGNDGSLMTYFEQMNKPSNFFWCTLKGSETSERVKKLIASITGSFIEIDGFDEIMHELLWVFDEIKPVEEELKEISKQRIDTASNQLKEIKQNAESKMIEDEDTKLELSAFEYANKAEREPDYEKRKDIYLEALDKFPNTGWLWNNFTYFLHHEKEDFTELEKFYMKALSVDPDNAVNNGNYAEYLNEIKNNYDTAEKYYLKALSIDPDDATINGNYARYLKEIKEDYDTAEKYYLKALSINPDDAIINGNYAEYMKEIKKDYDTAEIHYLKALSHEPDHVLIIGNYAVYLEDIRKDYISAEKYYLNALSINPDNAINNGNYALFLVEKTNKYNTAEKYYLKALSKYSNDAYTNGNYAQLLFLLNRKNEAQDYLNKGFKSNKNEKTDILIKLWFFRYAHCLNLEKESEINIEELLSEGLRSRRRNFGKDIEIAIKNGHPNPEKLKEFAKRITEE